MNRNNTARVAYIGSLSLAAILVLSGVARAQSTEIKGVINGRSGPTMTVQTQESGNVVVVLNDETEVEDVAGIFHARKKQMGMAVLVPGLQVDVKGSDNSQNQLVASTIRFNGKQLQTATDIQAGVAPVEAQVKQQQQVSAEHQQEIAAEQAKIGAVPEGQDGEGLCDSSQGLRIGRGVCCPQPEAKPGAGSQRHRLP